MSGLLVERAALHNCRGDLVDGGLASLAARSKSLTLIITLSVHRGNEAASIAFHPPRSASAMIPTLPAYPTPRSRKLSLMSYASSSRPNPTQTNRKRHTHYTTPFPPVKQNLHVAISSSSLLVRPIYPISHICISSYIYLQSRSCPAFLPPQV